MYTTRSCNYFPIDNFNYFSLLVQSRLKWSFIDFHFFLVERTNYFEMIFFRWLTTQATAERKLLPRSDSLETSLVLSIEKWTIISQCSDRNMENLCGTFQFHVDSIRSSYAFTNKNVSSSRPLSTSADVDLLAIKQNDYVNSNWNVILSI